MMRMRKHRVVTRLNPLPLRGKPESPGVPMMSLFMQDRQAAAAAVLFSTDAATLMRVREPGVQAVIVEPAAHADWQAEVAAAVEGGRFVIPRATLAAPRWESLAHVLESHLPQVGLAFETRLALIDDLVALAEALTAVAACHRLMLRVFTEPPTEHCGFHLDTVAPGCPPYGLLKVYNGAGTRYVDAADVPSMRMFYDYLALRERLVRERHLASAGQAQALQAQARALDAGLPFLRPGAPVQVVPAGATVAFRHLDVREHGSDHPSHRAWIHCSPMAGAARLVASFTPLDAAGARRG